MHGIARAIYGPDGPSERPKHKSIQIQHGLAIILGIDPDQVPLVPCRIAHRGFIQELLSYWFFWSNNVIASLPKSSAVRRENDHLIGETPPQHRLQIGIKQLLEFSQGLSWRMAPRIIYFLPLWLLRRLTLVSLTSLVAYGLLSSVSYPVFLLVLAHVVLLFRKHFWAPIPSYTSPEALDNRFTAEYERAEEKEDWDTE